ncbi:MAG: class I SAM-dependent methyltransferase [Myxococcota bacterium]
MNEATARELNAINRTFYRDHARTFSDTRRDPWPGWTRVVSHLDESGEPGCALSVLDVGCGNARLARFLSDAIARPVEYRGIDSSASLIAEARHADTPGLRAEFEARDLVENPLDPPAPSEAYDCATAFGILHHIPGRARRRGLLERLAERLAPGGLLALAFWDFGADPRFARKILELADYSASAARPLDAGQLEPGDALLRWGEPAAEAVRYCHWVDAAEEQELTSGLGLEALDAYACDGRSGVLNRYRLLRRPR